MLKDNTIFLTIHGSQAYGLNGPNSDLDIKGICIPPKSVANNLFQKFEQAIDPKFIDEDYSHLKNPNNPKLESSVYSLDKFIKLASMVNPNVIELLFVDSKSILFSNKTYDILRENNRMFLSKRARHTFSGYAMAQLKKIERHRKWLIMGELKKPNRVDFGLPDIDNKDTNEI